ncbi:MAG TPA: tetratricopeptide repeat protein [Methylomirabilota bacterium]|nr:tetratricopeptide repeat protein [Methylomirabilota bacterium]
MRTSVCGAAFVFALVLGSAENGFDQGPRHFREGLEAYQRGDFDAAIRSFTLAIENGDLPHPDIFFAFNNRGNAHAAKRDSVRALQDYDEALRLNPKYAGAMRNRGLVHAAQGDYDHAIRDFSEAARLDPDDPHALIGRGLVHCARHAFTDAVRDFDAALRICPSCSRAIAGRAAAAVGKECG